MEDKTQVKEPVLGLAILITANFSGDAFTEDAFHTTGI